MTKAIPLLSTLPLLHAERLGKFDILWDRRCDNFAVLKFHIGCEALKMWRRVCHRVKSPGLKRKLCTQLLCRKFPTHIELTVCRQQCTCADCLATPPSRLQAVDCVWNMMAHAQKTDFVFVVKGRCPFQSVSLGRQFIWLLAAEVCTSAVVMLDTACSEVAWSVMATHRILHFSLLFPTHVSPCDITFQLESTLTLQMKALYTLNCREHHHPSEDHHCDNLRHGKNVKFVLLTHFWISLLYWTD